MSEPDPYIGHTFETRGSKAVWPLVCVTGFDDAKGKYVIREVIFGRPGGRVCKVSPVTIAKRYRPLD